MTIFKEEEAAAAVPSIISETSSYFCYHNVWLNEHD